MSPIVPYAAVLAHQGGWDEVALVGAPILVIIGLLAIAKRRIDAQSAHNQPIDSPDHDST